MELQKDEILTMKPNHLFRYASEWDPREPGHTKGGYLEGKLILPRDHGDLRVVFSTVADTPLNLDPEITRKYPDSAEIHPTLLYVVRKGKGNRRMNEREPVPNHHHWRQEFHIVDRCVRIRNRTSDADIKRYDKMEKLPELDDVFMLGSDMVLNIGKGSGELNLIILIPKTEARSFDDEVTINKIIADRVPDPDAMESVLLNYKKKTSANIKKLKIKVEIFSLQSNLLISSAVSSAICDTASKEHGAMDFAEASPLRSCSKGGRKVLMVAESQIAKDVEPMFLLYDQNGRRLEEMDHILTQPNDPRNPDAKNVAVMKETIIFITPPQPNIEMIMKNGWSIKLAGVRKSDGFQSSKKFNFNYVPDDFYSPCIFCELKPDGNFGKAVLPKPIEPARPGIKKRRMPEIVKENDLIKPETFIPKEFPSSSAPKFRFGKIPCLDGSLSNNGMPALEKLLGGSKNPASHTGLGNLKLKPISSLQRTYTTTQAEEIVLDGEKNIRPQFSKKSSKMPDLIELHQLKSLKPLQGINPIKDPVLSLNHKSGSQENSKEDPFRAALQKLVNKQSPEPTMLEKLLFPTKDVSEKSLPFLIKLEENISDSPERPGIFPSLPRNRFKETEKRLMTSTQNPFVIKLETEEELMEPETTRPDLTPECRTENISCINASPDQQPPDIPDTTSQQKGNRSEILPRQKIEALLKSLERSRSSQSYGIDQDLLQKKKAPQQFGRTNLNPPRPVTSSNIELVTNQLSQSELDNLNNLDILDKIFHPLPPSLNDKLHTNYNYASISKKMM